MNFLAPVFPTNQHASAAEAITSFFSRQPGVDSVLLMGSCARGKAVPDSCLDILILCRPDVLAQMRKQLQQQWDRHLESQKIFTDLRRVGAFSHVDLEIIDGEFNPDHHDHGWTTGADEFELEVGNSLAYSVPLWNGGTYYHELLARWLPYYPEEMWRERLKMVMGYCRNNLAHVPLYAPRGLYFQCFKRLYNAFEEFLQALFIYHRKYPIAYDKWVKEGIVEVLGLPDLYPCLVKLFEISNFESDQIVAQSQLLSDLVNEYILET